MPNPNPKSKTIVKAKNGTKAAVKPMPKVVKPMPKAPTPKRKATPKELEAINYRSVVAKQKAATSRMFGPSAGSSDAKYYLKEQLKKQGVPKEYWGI
jgi:hypothetical protein